MSFGKEAEVNIPAYEKPEASSFDLYGTTGSYNKDTNTYSVSDPNELATLNSAKEIRSSLLNSLGLGGDISQDAYTQEYMNEILRLTQPKTENALIGRGLGGSTVYKDALTDLITKAGSQAILGGQQYKTNDLNALNSYITGQQSLGQNLLNMTTSQYNTDQSNALQQYLNTLPYTASVDQGTDYSGLLSLASGLLTSSATSGLSNLFSGLSSVGSTASALTPSAGLFWA